MSAGGFTHECARAETDVWLTPRWVLDALGPFDLDPCAALEQPWPTAASHYTQVDSGLMQPWFGRVWLNPPYGRETVRWLDRLAGHGDGVALVFARTETDWFHRAVWSAAHGVLFLQGRIRFCRPDGREASNNGGAPSVLVAYGERNVRALMDSGIAGHFVPVRRRLRCGR